MNLTSLSRMIAAAGACFVVVFSALFGAGTAFAHGGPIELSLSPDGAGGVQVLGTYVEDGHSVDEIMDVTVTAVSSDGRSIGPVTLISASEGQGVWVSPEPFLESGDWAVTATITTPNAAQTTTSFTVAPLAPPVDSSRTDAPLPSPDEVEASASNADESSMQWMIWAISIGVVVAAAVATVVLLARKRSRRF